MGLRLVGAGAILVDYCAPVPAADIPDQQPFNPGDKARADVSVIDQYIDWFKATGDVRVGGPVPIGLAYASAYARAADIDLSVNFFGAVGTDGASLKIREFARDFLGGAEGLQVTGRECGKALNLGDTNTGDRTILYGDLPPSINPMNVPGGLPQLAGSVDGLHIDSREQGLLRLLRV